MDGTAALAIEHIENSSRPAFALRRLPDGKAIEPVSIPSPYDFAVEGQPNSNLMLELRWYLEEFLDYPFHPDTLKAEHVLDSLRGWGSAAFNALFDRRDAGSWLAGAQILHVRSDDAHILSWPWEALFDSQTNYLVHHRSVERRLNKLADPPPLADLPTDRINILLVVARPYERDVRYRSIARPLVELIREQALPAHVDVLRPPTFEQLRKHLRAQPGYYHLLHFDGHGAFGIGARESTHDHGPSGCLVFEGENGEADTKSAGDLSTLLREHAVPAVVLNACQSGMLIGTMESPFSSVATALLQSGMRSVVAMAYSLYVSGAQVFLPAFYRRLFEAGSVAQAVRAGRQQMLAQKDRVCARGRYPLEDWLLPVLYQQDPIDFGFAALAKVERAESRLPQEVRGYRDPYGFVGRDSAILAMERALHRKTPAILVQGLGGVGKTTLARGFLRWLDETGGLDGALWYDFRDIRAAEYVINQTGQALYGENFGVAPNKLALLGRALREKRVLMVWDNFESSAVNLTGEDRLELGRFLDEIRGGRGKVIIASRSQEEWLGPTRRIAIRLGGLDGEERWEYCEIILRELGLKVNRNDAALVGLMDQLAGHPLAMRVLLPKLEEVGAAKIAALLRTNIAELGLSEEDEEGRLFGMLRFVEQGVASELRPLLELVGLHEGCVGAGYLEAMAKRVDTGCTRERIDRFLAVLGAAGLVRAIGSVHEMHPLLTSYLRSRGEATKAFQQAFVDVMGQIASILVPKEYHEQQILFRLHGANLHFALTLAERLGMDEVLAALTQALAVHAYHSRNFGEACRLYERLVQQSSAKGNIEMIGVAYHQLGMVAERRRDFAQALKWYVNSLAAKEKQGDPHGAAITYHQLGNLFFEQRDFATAREWYLKAVAIKEGHGNLRGAAITYHNLGVIAEEQRDFATARKWHLKSLAISEKQDDLDGIASSYHNLGTIAQRQTDLVSAREWYLKSVAIKEKKGNLNGATITYYQLGLVAEEQRDFTTAREWYLKSLAIDEKRGDMDGAADTYFRLGCIAEEQREFAMAREWYLKSLTIREKHGNLHDAAKTYGALGILAGLQDSFEESGQWLVQSIKIFRQDDLLRAQAGSELFRNLRRRSPRAAKQKLETLWSEAGLGSLP